MENASLTFLSSRGTGLNADLKMVQTNLTETGCKLSYRFFLNNEKDENPMAVQGYTRAKREFCNGMTNVICTDASLSANIDNLAAGGIRLLLAAPYDYQFKRVLTMRRNGEGHADRKTFQNFTHIIPGSPFTSQLFRNTYAMENIQVLEDLCMPLAWEINREEQQEGVRRKLQFYFPAIGKKKIFSIILNGKLTGQMGFFDSFDILSLVDKLGPDWFVITNQPELMEKAYVLDSYYKDSFGYANHIMQSQDPLYVSDVLVTNNGRFASAFITRKKPVYCLGFKGNSFEQYMRECHPDMFVGSFAELQGLSVDTGSLSGAQQQFHDQMSYGELRCPYGAIRRLFLGCADKRVGGS